jgi:hypothetical protein
MQNGDAEQFAAFVNDHPHWSIYRVEWQLFDEDEKLAGTPDAVFVDTLTNGYVLVDWKRVRDIVGYNKMAIYSLQLNLYAEMLRRKYDVDVGDQMYLIVIHPELPAYRKIQVKRDLDITSEYDSVKE